MTEQPATTHAVSRTHSNLLNPHLVEAAAHGRRACMHEVTAARHRCEVPEVIGDTAFYGNDGYNEVWFKALEVGHPNATYGIFIAHVVDWRSPAATTSGSAASTAG